MQFKNLDNKSNEEIIDLYFEYIGKNNILRAIEAFLNKSGFGILDVGCEFASNYKEWEEGYFGNKGVQIAFTEPLVDSDYYRVVSENELIMGAEKAITSFGNEIQDKEKVIQRLKMSILD